MKGNKEVIRALNLVLGQSLIAINQYFFTCTHHQKIGASMSLMKYFISNPFKEMKWSDELIERILLLEGLPNLQDLGKLLIGEDVAEILVCDLKLEKRKHDILVEAIGICEDHRDYVSREILVKLKDENEEYEDWLTTQQELIEDMGIQNYIQLKAQDND